MNSKIHTLRYVIIDVLSAVIAWVIFFIYRKFSVDPHLFNNHFIDVFKDRNLYIGLIFIPQFWLILYYLAGNYRTIYRKSRMQELCQTLYVTVIGVLILFFILILDDVIVSYKSYYRSFTFLFFLHFFFTCLFRFMLTTRTIHQFRKGLIGFNTLIVGGQKNSENIFLQMTDRKYSTGQRFLGFVHVNPSDNYLLEKRLPHFGEYQNIPSLLKEYKIDEIVIAVEDSESKVVEDVLLSIQNFNVMVKIIPHTHDFLLGSIKATDIFGTPLIQISPKPLPVWQQVLKRIIDVLFSLIAIVLLSPIYIFAAIGVKLSSPGPILYNQERIGKFGKPFMMYKFRSMKKDAEKMGTPQLSSDFDPRITEFGKIMRKTRIDELPQFFTVLKGEMSIVGPRPERQYFIDQIVQRAPYYKMLHRIRPGITSWGQVKYGYAENVDEMIERLKYDMLYLENMSLAMDFKILIYTVLIVIQGRGK